MFSSNLRDYGTLGSPPLAVFAEWPSRTVHRLWPHQARHYTLGCASCAYHALDSFAVLCIDYSPALFVFAQVLNFVADGREAPQGRWHEQEAQEEGFAG